ncbi:MAG TPA: hypothetical protein VJX94_17030 [Stellaceae bacterium]|nr:hypothetical protein [Stellaceae bacterium]
MSCIFSLQFEVIGFVLRTSLKLSALRVALRYRKLLAVEDNFKTAKAVLATRPIFHRTDAAMRGHIFCTFLALVSRMAIDHRRSRRPERGRGRTGRPPRLGGAGGEALDELVT